MAYAVEPGTNNLVLIVPSQLAAAPITPPDIGAPEYGRMSWDIADAISSYSAGQQVTATIDLWNPSEIDRLYGAAYYFINPDGAVVEEDYIHFITGGMDFSVFILHAESPDHMVTSVIFSAPGAGYKFGLRLLELEMQDSVAVVKGEVSRLEVLLGGSRSSSGTSIVDTLLPAMVAVGMMGVMAKLVSNPGKLPTGGK